MRMCFLGCLFFWKRFIDWLFCRRIRQWWLLLGISLYEQPEHFDMIIVLLGSLDGFSVVQWFSIVCVDVIFCFFPIIMLLFFEVASHFRLLGFSLSRIVPLVFCYIWDKVMYHLGVRLGWMVPVRDERWLHLVRVFSLNVRSCSMKNILSGLSFFEHVLICEGGSWR